MLRERARHRVALICGAAVLGAAFLACDRHSPIEPSGNQGGLETVFLKDLRIEGNLQLAGTNDTSQLRALVVMSDGATTDVTQVADWQATGCAAMSQSQPGLMRAWCFGIGAVTVRHGLAQKTMPVRAMPGGEFVLAGFVHESGLLPVGGATVEAIQGPLGGKSTRTDSSGRFSLTPVDSGPVTLRVSATGYATTSRQMTVNDDLPGVELILAPALSPLDLSGEYRMTVEAASMCELPPEIRTRHYTATIGQIGARFIVKLSRAPFNPCYAGGPPADHFDGRILDGNKVSFQVGWDDESCNYDILERVTNTTYIEFSGAVSGVATARTIAGEFDGPFGLYDLNGGFTRSPIAVCVAKHSLRFTR